MEESEKNLIKKNLPSLIQLTTCSTELLVNLQSANVLSDDEVERIATTRTKIDQAYLLYKILVTRKNGFIALLQALIFTRQSGAERILLDITVEELGNLQVELPGINQKIKTFLRQDQLQSLQQELRRSISSEECLEIRQNVLNKDITVRLLSQNIPSLPPNYIPRFLSRRLIISSEVFAKNCSDIFVFQGIGRMDLRDYVDTFPIYESSEQLRYNLIISKFILLEKQAHWAIICRKATVPVHLIKFESETETFVLVSSENGTETIQEYLKHRENSSFDIMSEDELLENVFNDSATSVAICDAPGMGKSLLMTSFARKVSEKYTDMCVSYIELRNFQISNPSVHNSNPQNILLQHISSSPLSSAILSALINFAKIRFSIFFDGLDEVAEANLDLVVAFLCDLRKTIPTCKIFITSRPVVRGKLEEVVGFIAYDLQTFNFETQANFLKINWSAKYDTVSSNEFTEYAYICIEKFETLLGETENRIAGVPLLCKMIAVVFADEAFSYVESKGTLSKEELCISANSFVDVYSLYMERQLGKTKCSFACIKRQGTYISACEDHCRIKSFHVRLALELLCPEFFSQFGKSFDTFEKNSSKQKLSPNVIKQKDSLPNQNFEFVHRTFAEYLVAEFCTNVVVFGFQSLIDETIFQYIVQLRDNGISYFLNALIKVHLSKARPISNAPTVRLTLSRVLDSLLYCVRHSNEGILEVILCTQTTYNLKGLWQKLEKNSINKETVLAILDCASRYCTAQTVKRVDDFFLQCYDYKFIEECSKMPKFKIIVRHVVSHVRYDLTCLLIDKTKYYKGLLGECLESSCFEDDVLVEKRLDVALLVLTKWSDVEANSIVLDDLLETVFMPSVHKRAIYLLLKFHERVNKHIYESKYIATSLVEPLCELIGSMFNSVDSSNLYEVLKISENFTGLSSLLDFLKSHVPSLYLKVIEQPFLQAIKTENLPVLNELLDRYIALREMQIDKNQNETPVLYSVQWRKLHSLHCLASKSANVFAVNSSNENVLHIAARMGDWKVFHRVVEIVGKNHHVFSKKETLTCDLTPQAKSKEYPNDVLEFFSWEDNSTLTPLDSVCMFVDLPTETLELFLACGIPDSTPKVNINAIKDGFTPLTRSLKFKRSLNFVKDLVSCGADWRYIPGENVGHICASENLWEHLKFFVDLGIDINEKTQEGDNLLQLSLKSSNHQKVPYDVLKLLVVAGTDLRNTNIRGETAIDIAVHKKYPNAYLAIFTAV